MDFEKLISSFTKVLLNWATSSEIYSQLGLILIALVIAYSLGNIINNSVFFYKPTTLKKSSLFKKYLIPLKDLTLPLIIVLSLSLAIDVSDYLVRSSSVVRVFLSLSVVFMIYSVIKKFIIKKFIRKLILLIVIPISLLRVFGLLNEVTAYLDRHSLELGTINISLYGLARVAIFGSLLFWLGRVSNKIGQDVIRRQEDFDQGTREVFAKLFQVALGGILFTILLQIMGINLATLAVFGGALGVGLGFGLQSIASNFISGIILLLERSISVGDYVEMGDGKSGVVRELNMRSTTLESFDGKDIMIPNEKFITTEFTNWTHKNKKQRYSLEFQVSYDTDLETMLDLVREAVRNHPKVLEGESLPNEERADAEIKSFGDSGVDILVEFWMEGIDDGENRVGADLLMIIWNVLKENKIEIPFPQRVIHMNK